MSTGTCIIEINYAVISTVIYKNTTGSDTVGTIPQDSSSGNRFIINETAIGQPAIAIEVNCTAIIGTVISKSAVCHIPARAASEIDCTSAANTTGCLIVNETAISYAS